MASLSLNALTAESIRSLCRLSGHDVTEEPWRTLSASELSDDDRRLVSFYTSKNFATSATAMNESTVWSRVIYPLLMLAEVRDVRAWSQVPLTATIPTADAASPVTLTGVVDGVLAPESPLRGTPDLPYLLVVEAKRGMDASDPRPQMLGAILAAAVLRRESADRAAIQYGCYTVGDVWTFVRARVAPAADAPLDVHLEWSREYAERHEPEAILKLLRGIAAAR